MFIRFTFLSNPVSHNNMYRMCKLSMNKILLKKKKTQKSKSYAKVRN